MYFSENTEGWNLVYEEGTYSLYEQCVQMTLFENFVTYK